jgi:excisionase family DNA binding protein
MKLQYHSGGKAQTMNTTAEMSVSHSNVNDWMTSEEAAEYLRAKPRSVQLWTRQGKLKGHAVTGSKRHRWLYLKRELDAALIGGAVVSCESPAVLKERKVM